MNRFHLKRSHIGQLISGVAGRLNPAAATSPEAGQKDRAAAANSYKCHAATAIHASTPRGTTADALAMLDASKRRWPSRYY